MLMMVLAGQSVWAQEDFATNVLQIGNLDAQYQTVAPGWKSFVVPSVRVYHRTGGQDVVETNKYVLTYLIDGMNSTDVTVDPVSSRNITTDTKTNTKVDYNYGTVTVGNKTETVGEGTADETTVTVKVVATPQPAYASSLTVLENTYSFIIKKQTPVVTLSQSSLSIPVFHTQNSYTENDGTIWSFDNTSEKVTVPTATISVTHGSYTQDLTDAFTISYSVLAGTIDLVDDNSAIQAHFNDGEASNARVTTEVDVKNPYASGERCSATLRITLTPKDEYDNAYTTVTQDVPVTIFVLDEESEKLSVDFTIDVPDGGFQWSRYNENKFTENDRTIHQLPRPKVTASNGNDLSHNGDFSVIYFAVDDQTYKDYCQMNEINVGQKATLLSSGTIWEAGNPTEGGISGTNFVYGYLNQNDAAFRYTSNKAGHLKIGMFIYATDTSSDNIAKLYKYQDDNIINSAVTNAANIINDGTTPISWGRNPQTWTGDNFRRVSPVKFFDIDVMHRTPILTLDPDPTDITVSTSDTITFNNRFELTGSIDDRNDGSEGHLIFGAPDANSDHFSYSFEFSKDAGIKVLNWPHGEYVFALNSEGNIIEPITRDAAGLPVYTVYKTEKQKYYPAGEDVNPYWYEWRDVPTTTPETLTAEEAAAWNTKYGVDIFHEGDAKDVTSLISTYKYFSVKGYNTDKSWAMIFTKDGGYDVKYTIYPYNHVRWDVSSTITKHYTVQVGKTPVLKIDPKSLVATVSQVGFVEPDVWVEDMSGLEVTKDFQFKYEIVEAGGTGTTVASPFTDYGTLGKPDHEINIGGTAGEVTVKVYAYTENASYTTVNNAIFDTYTIRILDNPASGALYEIISSHDDDAGNMPNTTTVEQYAAAAAAKMGKMHFINTGSVYAGYTISGIPGLELRLGSFDGTIWEVKQDDTSEIGAKDNNHDMAEDENDVLTAGLHNKFIGGDTSPVVLDEKGIATGGCYYEFYAHTNGLLTVDGRFEVGKKYVLIDYDYPSNVQIVEPSELIKGEFTFEKPLLEDHSYHLYCATAGSSLHMHGVRFDPVFLNPANNAVTTKATSFMNGFGSNPLITAANHDMEYDSYTSVLDGTATDASAYAEVGIRSGKVTPKALTYPLVNHKVNIRAKVTSSITSPKGNPIYKWPKYDLVIGDIPTYRLGDQKRENYAWANDGLKKDGFVSSGTDDAQNAKGTIYVPVPGDTVSTYNILTPIRMTYGGWQNQYKYKAIGVDGNVIKSKVAGQTDQDSIVIRKDEYQAKSNAEVAGLTDTDTQFNKYIDNFTWSNVAKQNPSDENNSQNYRNYITDPAYMPADGQKSDDYLYGINGVSKDNKRGFYKNTFTLPAHGAYWRFEPRVSGTLFVYLVQNGLCSYTGNPSLLGSNSKNYELLDWKPLYIVDETGQNVSTDIELGDGAISSFMEESGAYTEGLLRCDKNDSYIRQITDPNPNVGSKDFTFLWENGKTGNDAKGFSVDYRGDASNLESLKNQIITKWTGAGDVEQVVTDIESNGHILISKSYVRYAVNVKAGKSYWVFQHGSKPNFCGFAFVPTGYPDTMGETPVSVTIDDTNTLDQSLAAVSGGAEAVYGKTSNVTYSGRTFYNNRWTSLCLPFAVSEYNFKKVFGENAKIVTFDQITKDLSYIHFTMHNYHMLEAGRPYFVCPNFNDNSESKTNLVFEGVTIEKVGDGYIPAASNSEEPVQKQRIIKDPNGSVFEFVGTYNGETMNKYSYFLNGNTGALTRNVWDNVKCGNYRAYLKNSTSDSNQARLLSTTYNEPYEDKPEPSVPTTIVGIPDGGVMEAIGSESAKGIYTIDGKKLSASAKDRATLPAGVYIIDGKKQVVK